MDKTTPLDMLAIAAHRDDAEITSGGLLLKMAAAGCKTGILDLTAGEMGTHGDENDRATEAANAAKALELSYRGNLGLPDARLELVYDYKLRIAEVIRATQPELVVLPHWEQRHPDHRICSQLGYDACFLAGLKKLDIGGEPHRPRKIIYASYYRNTTHSFLVDISDHFEQKCRAVAAYVSQFGNAEAEAPTDAEEQIDQMPEGNLRDIFQPGVNIYNLMQARARQLGQLVGVEYAEAYTIKENILIDDPVAMPVQSI